MKILSQNSITMKIFWMCGWLCSIAFAKPISQAALQSALENMDPKQLAVIQRNVQALSVLAAKVMPTGYGDGGSQSLLRSTKSEIGNDERAVEKDFKYDAQNYRAADDKDYQDFTFDNIYNTMNYETSENSDNSNEAENDDVNAKVDNEEQKDPPADANKDNAQKKPSSGARKDNDKKKPSSIASKVSAKKATEPRGQAVAAKEKKKP